MQTTITAWALPYDILIPFAFYKASQAWPEEQRTALCIFILSWTFLFSKTVKLWGHFLRYPADIFLLPLYVSFGYFHGFIKFWGLLTLSEVSYSASFKFQNATDKLRRRPGAAEMAPMPTIASA